MLPPFTPDPILVTLGPITVYWYGVMYAIGLLAVWLVLSSEVRRRGLDVGLLVNGMIIVAAAALVGGRLYHVIDQWALYQDDPIKIILPPYSGLGAFGGLILGTIAGVAYAAYKRQPILVWADAVTPGILIMQAFARWGNFFNQELYGPPTDLPWGIAIDCAHRVAAYPCETYPFDTTRFQPLFLYESLSGLIGAVVLLWVARRFASKLLAGDIALLVFAWYSATRFLLEPLRTGNWTLEGIPTASIISGTIAVGAIAILVLRHLLHRRDEKVAARAVAAAIGASDAAPAADAAPATDVAAVPDGPAATDATPAADAAGEDAPGDGAAAPPDAVSEAPPASEEPAVPPAEPAAPPAEVRPDDTPPAPPDPAREP
jgi:phosphatidylglycerol:prolipoprotein diacylglycerol transferase